MRGTDKGTPPARSSGRFIPARAGNGTASHCAAPTASVHPRACGERGASTARRARRSGSSPRVRGTASLDGELQALDRFIPARAGNGGLAGLVDRRLPVHPRACGERRYVTNRRFAAHGSSPRVRGTDPDPHAQPGHRRFIPARAGNGSANSPCSPRKAVHPRACGERGSRLYFFFTLGGSSPRVRGTAPRRKAPRAPHRFIPARAGNGSSCKPSGSRTSVHPRACGERHTEVRRSSVGSGSSPRVRGTVWDVHSGTVTGRFIPARAGNGPAWGRAGSNRTVHPRACGERTRLDRISRGTSGSSPRVRGTGALLSPFPLVHRFIPARAGNGRRFPGGG